MKFLREFIIGKPEIVNKESPKILPFDVRYALRYKGGRLNRTDVEALVRNGLENEALYLTFKSLINNPDQHRVLLEKYISHVLENDDNPKTQKDILEKLITEAWADRDDISIEGGKLAQLSRQGFDLWHEKFKLMASRLSNDDRSIFLVTNPILIGLGSFVQAFSKKNKTLNILVPSWLGSENIGYTITFNDGKMNVEWLQGSFDKRDLVIIDDTRNSGNTLKKIKNYFIENGSEKPKILYMDKVRQTQQ